MNPTDAIILHLAPVPGRSFGFFFSASQLASSPDRLSVEALCRVSIVSVKRTGIRGLKVCSAVQPAASDDDSLTAPILTTDSETLSQQQA
ncbi:hypothetical protein VTJ04DRAFT_8572 [Mycothermus thermophilus]|uniref:uncharacterized protein n=1 Tax=Humicola insolens TaxID=85995 RepID=UPI00374356D8